MGFRSLGLKRNLAKDDNKIIVTTIQKLNNLMKSEGDLAIYGKQVVFIFDECHRSQFGEAQKNLKKKFKKFCQFGFTGTPIFEKNASAKQFEGEEGQFKTTEDLFQKQLHAYTITHAIEDTNVLRFHVDYYKPEGKNPPKPGEALAKKAVIEAILAKHDTATAGRRFNAVLATASINAVS